MKPDDQGAPLNSSRSIRQAWSRGVFFTFAMALAHGAVAAVQEQELLPAEKAFSASARLVNDRLLELRFDIADGYYMYRDRFRFSINTRAISLPRQSWPIGRWKQDVNFGKVYTYRGSVRILLPVSSTGREGLANAGNPVNLVVTSQGCADLGVCYPPLHQTLALESGSSGWTMPRQASVSTFSQPAKPSHGLGNRLENGK
ncbi:MAG: protein-disulfide reductase DsbD N-terminal domain-containing protein [Betaproteobacteria bacterium]